MIAKLDIKKCPFHKETVTGDRKINPNSSVLTTVYIESFLECIEGECMAWDQKARDCRLMMRDTKEEKK